VNEQPALSTVLDVCEHKYRRIALAALANQQQPISINDLTDTIMKRDHHTQPTAAAAETATEIQTALYHVHLPKLADAGFIQYDLEESVVEPTAQVEREESDLSTILAMDPDVSTTCECL